MKPPFVAPLLTLLARDSDAPGRQVRHDQSLLGFRERERGGGGRGGGGGGGGREIVRERRCLVSVLPEQFVVFFSREAWTPSTPSTHGPTVSPEFAAHHPQQGDHLKQSHKLSVLSAAWSWSTILEYFFLVPSP